MFSLIPPNHLARRQSFRTLVNRALQRGQVLVLPQGLGAGGGFFFGNAELLLIAFGPDAAKRIQQRRESAERSANRFKVLSDPTRSILLSRVTHGPMSITELADYFELAQPTVSVHIKMLREAGLLESARSGTHTLYSARRERLQEFIEEGLSELLFEDPSG